MEISLAFLIFSSALGILVLLYALHFRHRALCLGPEGLRSALARTLPEEAAASDEGLREGALVLEARFRRGITISSLLLVLVLLGCLLLTIFSVLPELTLALCGVCVLLLSLVISLVLLRELPRLVLSDLDKEENNS